jgi:hypothetical protein
MYHFKINVQQLICLYAFTNPCLHGLNLHNYIFNRHAVIRHHFVCYTMNLTYMILIFMDLNKRGFIVTQWGSWAQ